MRRPLYLPLLVGLPCTIVAATGTRDDGCGMAIASFFTECELTCLYRHSPHGCWSKKRGRC